MQGKNEEIFKGKTFGGLLEDIYKNTKSKQTQINVLISELKPLIQNIADAGIIVPLIAEYVHIGVDNDEHLVKMAAIVQRAMALTTKQIENGEFTLLEEEKKLILDQVKQMKVSMDTTNNTQKLDDTVQKVISNGTDVSDDILNAD